LSLAPADQRLAALPDGSVLASVVYDAPASASAVEIIDTAGWSNNLGGIFGRPRDEATGLRIGGQINLNPNQAGHLEGFVDEENGKVGVGPLPPGDYTATFISSGHASVSRPATVVAGQWTDLGDVLLPLTGTPVGVTEPYVEGAVAPGATQTLVVRGRGFQDGITVTPFGSTVVHGWTFVDWNELLVNATIDAAAPVGQSTSLLSLRDPGGPTPELASAVVTACSGAPTDVTPPAEVQLLSVEVTPSAPEQLRFR
jgi:hypothetical protein